MTSRWLESVQWNIFARELADVLQVHGLRLGHLDDRAVVLHPEKVRRLQQSLRTPTHFPVLNPDELDRLSAIVDLSDEERSRLRAALIATAVERTLMDRLDPPTALLAANDVFEICLAAMREQPSRILVTAVKNGLEVAELDEANDEADVDSWEAVDLLEGATLALDGAENASGHLARRANARTAQLLFARATAILDTDSAESESDEMRQSRAGEAHEGHTLATVLLQQDEAG
jgi:hypothetical protein